MFDGKKLHSHSTGRARSDDTGGDAEVGWSRQDGHGKDASGDD